MFGLGENMNQVINDKQGHVIQQFQLEVNVNNQIIIPGCEPTSSMSSRTLSAYMALGKYCKNALVNVDDVIAAIPGSYIKYGLNFNKGVRQRWLVLPPTKFDCPCEYNTDYYQILRQLPSLEMPVDEQYDKCDMMGMGYCPSPDFDEATAPAPSPYIEEGTFPAGGGVLPPIPPWVTR